MRADVDAAVDEHGVLEASVLPPKGVQELLGHGRLVRLPEQDVALGNVPVLVRVIRAHLVLGLRTIYTYVQLNVGKGRDIY